MDVDPKWYLLSVVLLILFAVFIPRVFDFPEYTDADIHDTCQEVFAKCQILRETQASESDWTLFQEMAMERLNSISIDIETHLDRKTPGSAAYYDIVKQDLPRLISSQGKSGQDISRKLALSKRMVSEQEGLRGMSRVAIKSQGWDPVVAGFLVFDGLLVVSAGVFWLAQRNTAA